MSGEPHQGRRRADMWERSCRSPQSSRPGPPEPRAWASMETCVELVENAPAQATWGRIVRRRQDGLRAQAEPRMWASSGSRWHWVLLGLPFVQAHRSNLITGWFLYMRPAESGLSAVGGARQACSFGNWRRAACVGAGLGPATLRDGTLGQAPATLRPPAREARSGGRTTVMAHRRAAASACCGSARGRVWPAVPFR